MTIEDIHAQCEPEGDCLIWQGETRESDGEPVVPYGARVEMIRLSARVWNLSGGGTAPHVIGRTCGDMRCLSEAHMTRYNVRRSGLVNALGEPRRPRGRMVAKPVASTEPYPPNSPESFAVCDAVRNAHKPDTPGMARPWLLGRVTS